MSEQLTDKQQAVLAVIERHWRAHGDLSGRKSPLTSTPRTPSASSASRAAASRTRSSTGDKLIDLLIEHGIGVRKRTVELLEVDPSDFQTSELGE